MSHGGRPSPTYDPAQLARLHHADGLTVREIAERLGKAPSTISLWMRESGIEVVRRTQRMGHWGGARGGRMRR